MMVVFASGFGCDLCILARTIFGSCSLLGYYMLTAKLQVWLASMLNFKQ